MEAAWEIVDPVLGDVVPVHPYARGSWGPKEADRLLPAGTPGTTRQAEPSRKGTLDDRTQSKGRAGW